MDEKACGSPENFRRRQLSHILQTVPTHATEYDLKKGFAQKNINTNNTSAFGPIVKNAYECVNHVAWERGCANGITLCMFLKRYRH